MKGQACPPLASTNIHKNMAAEAYISCFCVPQQSYGSATELIQTLKYCQEAMLKRATEIRL